ncbi:hypothetical protein BOX15_Mlig002170g1 [Macrostomum lignano]|uniref:Tubulin--tyrosine ligase-like protein 5 n=2 Tax=Macrostomum lignano TaxID=282301 RepID=A0A267F4A0_9PLAT|nr:hypothetical protein BOX15_Mlig002170g1 [Macrostomum lignano]
MISIATAAATGVDSSAAVIDDLNDVVPLADADANDDEDEDEDEDDCGGGGDGAIELCVPDAEHPSLVWCGQRRKRPILVFLPHAVERRNPQVRCIGEKYHLAFKIVRTECKLLKTILLAHGFHETHPNSLDFNLVWTGGHLKPYSLRGMTEFQKINHFPRSYELTRKDRLFKNVQRMQQLMGARHFDFVPASFILPAEYQDLCSYHHAEKGPFIVKPIASSRGRGIFIVNNPEQIVLDEQLVACKYIANPLLVDGFKFDLRIYVAVTSYDPLMIYVYEEGLARFATVRYQADGRQLRNQCMHLTNYSVNKRNRDFVQNDDAEVEDYGNKWSLGALLRYLRSEGHDTAALMMRIEDVVIKSILSVESAVSAACRMFQPHRGNCFELYGFDIILDEALRPWLLEVNLSPSLACDSPLDFKIKCNMLSDLLSLVGFVCQDPMLRVLHAPGGGAGARAGSAGSSSRPGSASSVRSAGSAGGGGGGGQPSLDEQRMLRIAREEFRRRGGWLRVFPSQHSWDTYSAFLQQSPQQGQANAALHRMLYPKRWPAQASQAQSRAGSASASAVPAGKLSLHSISSASLAGALRTAAGLASRQYGRIRAAYRTALRRVRRYESRLTRDEAPVIVNAAPAPPALRPSRQRTTTTTATTTEAPAVESSVEALPPRPPASTAATATGANARSRPPRPKSSVRQPTDPTSQQQQQRPASSGATPAAPPVDPESVVSRGGGMSPLQARQAFAAYLARIRRRLLADQAVLAHETLSPEDERLANDQLDLVLRFLRRADAEGAGKASGLPSRRLSLAQRQSVLAGLLADFVRRYARETETMRQRGEDGSGGLPAGEFAVFVRTAEEAQLEALLTAYTRANRSAGVFIRASPASSTTAAGPPPTRLISASASSAASSTGNSSGPSPMSLGGVGHPRRRPISASGGRQTQPSTGAAQPGVNGANGGGGGNLKSLTTYDEAALNAALQRLAVRQQSRQYAAYRVDALLSRPVSADPSAAAAVSTSLSDHYGPQLQAGGGSRLSAAATKTDLVAQIRQSRALLEASRAKHSAALAATSGVVLPAPVPSPLPPSS